MGVFTIQKPKIRKASLPLIRRIFLLLKDEYYHAKIARFIGKARSTVHYHIKRLEKLGYISFLVGCDNPLQFNDRGSIFLDGVESCVFRGRRLRMHNVVFKYRILREPSR